MLSTLTLLGAVLLFAGCGGMEFESVWMDGGVAIDGVPLDWRGATTWVESPNVAIGVKNDEHYLYLCVSSPVREIATQIAMRGFTVWLDPEGKKGKTFGIRCPVGPTMGTGRPDKLGDVARDRDKFMEMVVDRLKGAGNVMEILGPGEENSVRLAAGDATGIEVALGYYDGRVVYELKVPFRRDDEHPYAIGSDGKSRIGIGFETPEIEMDRGMAAMRGERAGGGRRGGGPPEGGPPSGGGPRGGGMGGEGRPGGAGGDMPDPIDIWGKIILAAAPVTPGDTPRSE
jgi:hypothetical protein